MQELNDLKSNLEQYQGWESTIEDAKAIAELLELESDEALANEAQASLKQLEKELELWIYNSFYLVLTIPKEPF